MAGIEDLIELFRGIAPSRSGLAKGFGESSGRYFTPDPKFARHIAQGGSLSQGKLIKDLAGKVKSLKIPVSKFKELGGNSLQVILDDASLGKAKTNLFQTMLAKAGSFTPLALEGLKILGSLPAATATMVLQSTPANADEVNMTLEDFAKLGKEKKNNNIDKALESQPKDI
jgi:hypothetical protein|tara:strand:+ start:43 stop:555 length:513 start_codon:yes stop_codon:yes gene_type:complete